MAHIIRGRITSALVAIITAVLISAFAAHPQETH